MDDLYGLKEEQLKYLESIKSDFRNVPIEDLIDWLTDYLQKMGVEDIDNNKEAQFVENIIDDLCDGVYE